MRLVRIKTQRIKKEEMGNVKETIKHYGKSIAARASRPHPESRAEILQFRAIELSFEFKSV
jgi:hypothetical protein